VLARSVADVALLLRLIAGPDGRDAGVAPVLLGDPADDELRGLRVAVHTDNGLHPVTPATVAAVERAAAALREAGAVVEQAEPPRGGHELTIEVWRSYEDGPSYRLLRRWDAFRGAMLAFPYDVILAPCSQSPRGCTGR
jgi:amidase